MNTSLMETLNTFRLMFFQHGIASTGDITVADIFGGGMVMDDLASMFHTVGTRRLISAEGAFVGALLDGGLTGDNNGIRHGA